MKKLAHYTYGKGEELFVYLTDEGVVTVRDITGNYPISPIDGLRTEHPCEEAGILHVPEYETLGLYYKLDLSRMGWGTR